MESEEHGKITETVNSREAREHGEEGRNEIKREARQ